LVVGGRRLELRAIIASIGIFAIARIAGDPR
jgi:hypothetical protein